jgi:hypothetical protein
VPIITEIYKLFTVLKSWKVDYNYIADLKEIIVISILYLGTIVLISKYFSYHKESRLINENVNNEINNHLIKLSKFDVKYYKSIRKEFIELKKNKENIDKRDYLVKLIKLRDQMTI